MNNLPKINNQNIQEDKNNKYCVIIRFESLDYKILDNAIKKVINVINSEKLEYSGPIIIPTKRFKFALRRAPNIYKVSFEKYEYRKHNRIICINNIKDLSNLKFLGKVAIPHVINIKMKFKKIQIK